MGLETSEIIKHPIPDGSRKIGTWQGVPVFFDGTFFMRGDNGHHLPKQLNQDYARLFDLITREQGKFVRRESLYRAHYNPPEDAKIFGADFNDKMGYVMSRLKRHLKQIGPGFAKGIQYERGKGYRYESVEETDTNR